MKNIRQIRATLLLLLTAVIWGLAFVAQEVGAEYLGTFSFNGIRFLLGAASLVPVILLFEREHMNRSAWKKLLGGSCVAGTVLFLASALQQYGVQLGTPAGKAGFITGLYTVIVPVLSLLLFHKKTHALVWAGAVLAVAGLLLLNLDERFNLVIGAGECCLIGGAVMWAVHILVVDRFVTSLSPLKFSMGQFIVCGVESMIGALLWENITPPAVQMAAVPLLYGGLMSVGVAYTCQALGQKDSDPTVAAIVFSMESVFSVIGGVLILHAHMAWQAYAGCGLILAGIIIAQIGPNPKEA
ncbi:MAG: DMT family transporter [Clostridia bacterium]|nr:DMT family transporter [Clostridia bacterium]MBQ1555656.1 DMT family transporter [Clostridia bacterium]